MKTTKSKTGAIVRFCNHRGVFAADVYVIEGAVIVRASGPVTPANINRSEDAYSAATHWIHDFPKPCFWRPELGLFVVPAEQAVTL